MLKIAIFEDDEGDVILRYGPLTQKEDLEVTVYFQKRNNDSYDLMTPLDLKRQGFPIVQMIDVEKFLAQETTPRILEEYSLIFTDGLRGMAYDLAKKANKAQVPIVMNSGGSGSAQYVCEFRKVHFKEIYNGKKVFTRDDITNLLE